MTPQSANLFLKGNRRPAHSGRLELDTYLDTVGNLDKRYAAVHPVLFAVKGHCAVDGSGAGTRARNLEGELLSLGYTANSEVAVYLEGVRTSLDNFLGVERDIGILFYVKKVLAF